MASGQSDFWTNKKLNAEFRGAALVFPTSIFIALVTVAATGSTGGTEVAAGGYGRIEVPMDEAHWNESVAREISNAIALTFPQASGAWGTVVGWKAMDQLVNGNMLWFGALNPSKPVGTGDVFQVPIGSVKFKSGVTA